MVILVIIIAVAAVVCVLRECKKRKHTTQPDRVLKPVNNQTSSKFGSDVVKLNKMVEEEEEDPLYQDDIQYSERTDQYYMVADEVKTTPRTKLPPPLPSAPIPTLERDNLYNDPVLNPAFRTDHIIETPTIEEKVKKKDNHVKEKEKEEDEVAEYDGVAYNNIPGVVHTIRPDRASYMDDNELQINFTNPNIIYENKQ